MPVFDSCIRENGCQFRLPIRDVIDGYGFSCKKEISRCSLRKITQLVSDELRNQNTDVFTRFHLMQLEPISVKTLVLQHRNGSDSKP